jgi:hypothetical protein
LSLTLSTAGFDGRPVNRFDSGGAHVHGAVKVDDQARVDVRI